jgi:hypothetical protein
MPRVSTAPWGTVGPRKPREVSKHDRLCVSIPGSVLRFCWCVCPKCWDKLASKCICQHCRCRWN